jgi:hypothetical protein
MISNKVLTHMIIFAILLAISSIIISTHYVSIGHSYFRGQDQSSFSIFDEQEDQKATRSRKIPAQPEQIVSDSARNSQANAVKIVAFTDNDYSVVAKWWYTRMTELKYTTHTLVLINPAAVKAFNDTNNSGEEYYRFDVQIVDAGNRRKNMVRSLWYNRILYCLNQLKAGQSLLLTDVDNIFTRYEPLSQFQESEFDAIFALEGRFPTHIYESQGFVFCGGMTFLKANEATVQIMEQLLEMCDGGTKRCDDQVEWNILLSKDMNWDAAKSVASRTDDGLVQHGFVGESKTVKGFKAKVWDRDFAWRGPFQTEHCPSEQNWVAMPSNLPFDITEQLEALHSKQGNSQANDGPQERGREKIGRVKIWELFCGKGVDQSIGDMDDRIRKAVDMYIQTLEAASKTLNNK